MHCLTLPLYNPFTGGTYMENSLEKILKSVGVAAEPIVVRLYRDEDRINPSLVVQRDIQGCRVMLRPKSDPNAWTCAWFEDSGRLMSIERFAIGDASLGSDQAEGFLNLIAGERIEEMARETISLGAN